MISTITHQQVKDYSKEQHPVHNFPISGRNKRYQIVLTRTMYLYEDHVLFVICIFYGAQHRHTLRIPFTWVINNNVDLRLAFL